MHVNLITEHCFGLIRKLRAGMPVFLYVMRRKKVCQEINFKEWCLRS